MSQEMFAQTRLERYIDGDRQEMVSYIPAKLATKSAVVDLKDSETDEWTRGWIVMDDCPKEMWRPYDVVNQESQNHKSQRIASDIERGSREVMKKKRH
jgi:hypothetical protein